MLKIEVIKFEAQDVITTSVVTCVCIPGLTDCNAACPATAHNCESHLQQIEQIEQIEQID